MNKFQAELREKQEQAWKVAVVDNKKAGDTFLAENRKKTGEVALPSDLQYKVIKTGDGKKPMETEKVEVKYRGTLLDGAEFDSSERSGRPTVTLDLTAGKCPLCCDIGITSAVGSQHKMKRRIGVY
jgi:FKBP-type peptidyl-prolyl cis-trans isomerase